MAAHSLRSAIVTPTGSQPHYVDDKTGRPVLVHWGLAAPGQEVPVLIDPPAREEEALPLAEATTQFLSGSGEPAMDDHNLGTDRSQSDARRSPVGFRWLPWLVPGALAVLLARLALRALTPLPDRIVEVIPEPPPADDPTVGLAERLAELEGALAEVQQAQPLYASACIATDPPPEIVALPTPPAAEPEPPQEIVELPEVEVEPEPEPVEPEPEEVEPEVAAVRPPLPDLPPLPELPPLEAMPSLDQASACDATWSPGRSPRMVFVVDGSGSMGDGIRGARSKMGAAKDSIGRVVRSLHEDIRIGLVSFSDCGATRATRYYASEERGQLLGRVNAIQPGEFTSLAASISRAGALATRRSEVVIVVVSDGKDTCGSDPCAAARAVRSEKPNVRINVIDLSGGGSGNVLSCVARAGGGRIFSPQTGEQMASQIQAATGQPDASGCT
ncbi:MAG: VWA domain-containing protein [Geminicoccaceae bacterium]